MDLRRPAIHSPPSSGFLAGRRLAALVAGLGLLALAPLTDVAGGSAGDHPSPLHLSGAPSSLVAGDYKLVTSAGPGPLPAPSATVVPGSGVTIGSYTYVYTVVDSGGESAPSVVSGTATTTAGNQQINVGGLPTGVTVRIYRRRSGLYNRVVELVNNSSPTYADTAADPPSVIVLPQAQNRVASAFSSACTATTCGWTEFAPGVPVNATSNSTLSTTAPTAPTGKGWLVEPSGSVHFAQGDWTFQVQTKSGVSTTGTARLVVGMWKVTTTGAAVGPPVIDPATSGEQTTTNLIDTTDAVKTVTHTVANVPAFTVGPGERLYAQFWRRQAAPYVSNFNNDARVVTLYAHDGVGRVLHPAVSTLPAAALSSPVDGALTAAAQLAAVFTDLDSGDTGAVKFRVCTAAAAAGAECGGLVASGSSGTVASGAEGVWSPGVLSRGTYYWQARAQDGLGGQSDWTATRSLVIDEAPSPALTAPERGAFVRVGDPRLRATFSDPDGDGGFVRFRVCTSPSPAGTRCASPVVRGSSATVASGTDASWRPESALRDGTYHWQVRAQDDAGAVSAWTATRKLVVAKKLIRLTSYSRLKCAVGGRLTARGRLARHARVAALFHTQGRVDYVREFGEFDRGTRTFSLTLPYTLARPSVYWVEWEATRPGEAGHTWMRVEIRPLRTGEVNPPSCRPA